MHCRCPYFYVSLLAHMHLNQACCRHALTVYHASYCMSVRACWLLWTGMFYICTLNGVSLRRLSKLCVYWAYYSINFCHCWYAKLSTLHVLSHCIRHLWRCWHYHNRLNEACCWHAVTECVPHQLLLVYTDLLKRGDLRRAPSDSVWTSYYYYCAVIGNSQKSTYINQKQNNKNIYRLIHNNSTLLFHMFITILATDFSCNLFITTFKSKSSSS